MSDLDPYLSAVDDAVRELVPDPQVRELIEAASAASRAVRERHEEWAQRREAESVARFGPAIEQALRLAMDAGNGEAPDLHGRGRAGT